MITMRLLTDFPLSMAKLFFNLAILFCSFLSVTAQTHGVQITNLSITPQKTCHSDGKITLTVANPQNHSLLFQLLSTDNLILKQQSTPSEFSNLSAGRYRVKIVNSNNHSIEYASQDVTISNQYKSITTAKVKIEGLCASFTPGAIIKVDPSSIEGGTPPYKYCFYKSSNPNFLDDPDSYHSSPTFTTPDFGTYQVRIKDACGEYTTITQEIQPTLRKVSIRAMVINNQVCGSGKSQLASVGLFDAITGGRLNWTQYQAFGGIKLEVREGDENGEVLLSSKIISDNSAGNPDPSNQDFVFKIAPSNKYWVKTTTPCGESHSARLDISTKPTFWLRPITAGCPGNGEGMKIANFAFNFAVYPTTVTIKKRATGEVMQVLELNGPEDAKFVSKLLPYDNYVLTGTNPCGFLMDTYNVGNPRTTPMYLLSPTYSLDFCDPGSIYTQEEGTTGMAIGLGGHVPDQENVSVRIIEGPSNVGVEGNYLSPNFRWYNMKPGNYKLEVRSCNTATVLEFECKPPKVLEQSIKSTAVSKCSGGGSIHSVVKYNSGLPMTIELLDENWQLLKESANGNFLNLAPGTYHTRMKMRAWCGTGYYFSYPQPLVITSAVAGPAITSTTGVACEDIHGALNTKGAIYLTLSASADAKLEYRKKGTSTWTELTYANSVEVHGLDVATYEVRLTSCGKSALQEVTVSKITPSIKTQQNHPCLDQPYSVSVPYYAGAIYAWIKNGQIMGNSHKLDFAKFEAKHSGVYRCKLQWGNCVTREDVYILNANLCGTVIGDIKLAGTVFHDKNALSDNKVEGIPLRKVSRRPLYIHVLLLNHGVWQHLGTQTPVEANGRFTIDGLAPNNQYRLILSTQAAPITSSIPINGWNFVGESTGNTGHDGTPDGILDINAGTTNQENLRFGLKQRFSLRSNRHITSKM